MFDIVDMSIEPVFGGDSDARAAAGAPKSAVNFLYMGSLFTFREIGKRS
jgi:hypothetical protein